MHPAVQSGGLLITSAAAQLITLVRPTPISARYTDAGEVESFSAHGLLLTTRERQSSMSAAQRVLRSVRILLRSFGTLAPR